MPTARRVTHSSTKPNLVLFVGAGFTKGLRKQAPVMDELFATVLKKARSLKEPKRMALLSKLIAVHFPKIPREDWGSINFEHFLTRMYKLRKLERRHKSITGGSEIEDVWALLMAATGRAVHTSLSYEDYENRRKLPKMAALIDMLTTAKEQCASVSIITTNYDLFADKAVGRIIDKSLHGPNVRYGDAFKYLERMQYGVPILGEWTLDNKGLPSILDGCTTWRKLSREIQLYKLHGSVNWAYCEGCHGIYGNFSFADLKSIFSLEKIRCPACGSHYDWLILPPIAPKQIKNPVITKIWRLAKQKLSAADRIVFIGYSFPQTDFDLAQWLIEACENSAARGRNWKHWIIDPDMNVHERCKGIFGPAVNQGKRLLFDPADFETQLLPKISQM